MTIARNVLFCYEIKEQSIFFPARSFFLFKETYLRVVLKHFRPVITSSESGNRVEDIVEVKEVLANGFQTLSVLIELGLPQAA